LTSFYNSNLAECALLLSTKPTAEDGASNECDFLMHTSEWREQPSRIGRLRSR
jgi:hypothetical protein